MGTRNIVCVKKVKQLQLDDVANNFGLLPFRVHIPRR